MAISPRLATSSFFIDDLCIAWHCVSVSTNCKAGYDELVLTLDDSSTAQLRDAIALASGRADVREAIDALYVHLQDVIDLRRPVCNASGRCCRFEEFGHRLFVTTMELAVFSDKVGARGEGQGASVGGCQFQVGGLCSVHTIRP